LSTAQNDVKVGRLTMDDEMTLPCGCVIGTVNDTFYIQACPKGLDCEYVQFVLAETEAQGKPNTILEP
jgi:hypothetical protein